MSRKQRILDQLSKQLNPTTLLVEDESHEHSRPGNETHFKVIAVSVKFNQRKLIERHCMVNAWLNEEFQTGLHALSLHLYTPEEWAKKPHAPQTPACQHKK